MDGSVRRWSPVVAERESSGVRPAVPFPCRADFNRYTGCIGARRCRAAGVSMCILGRWPDERRDARALAEREPEAVLVGAESPADTDAQLTEEAQGPNEPALLASPSRRPLPAAREAQPIEFVSRRPARAARYEPPAQPTVGLVIEHRRVWQVIAHHVAAAGYQPLKLGSVMAGCRALEMGRPLAAVLIDGGLAGSTPGGQRLLDLAAEHGVPTLSLPMATRDNARLESAARMVSVWLALTLRQAAAAS